MKLARKLVLYHGSARLWGSALEAHCATLGVGDTAVTDAHLIPMPGRIYLTPDANMALEYMKLGGKWKGAVLEVEVPRGADVLIDEDCVGQALAIYFEILKEGGWPGYLSSRVRGACGISWRTGWQPNSVASDLKTLEALHALATQHVSKQGLSPLKAVRATVRVYANVGKILSPVLTPELALRFLEHGANLAVKPPVRVLGGWVFSGPGRERGWGRPWRAFSAAPYIPNVAGRRTPPLPVVDFDDPAVRRSHGLP